MSSRRIVVMSHTKMHEMVHSWGKLNAIRIEGVRMNAFNPHRMDYLVFEGGNCSLYDFDNVFRQLVE